MTWLVWRPNGPAALGNASTSITQVACSHLVLGAQASPAFPGQTSGVVGMAQASQPIQFSVSSPQVSPQASPQFSPQSSAVVFSQPEVGARHAIGPNAANLSPNQVSDQLQRSGVDLARLSAIAQESPFSLSQASSPMDGSFIRTFGLDTGHDVADWELYDGVSKNGTLILGVNDRVRILVEGTKLFPDVLLQIASKDKFDDLNSSPQYRK